MIFHNGGLFMPGRHVTDQQMRLFMTLKQTHTVPVAAAKAGISQATGYRIQSDPTLPSQKKKPRGRRRPDLDLSRFDAAPLIAFIAAKETNYGNETNGRIPGRCSADRADKRADTQAGCV